MRKFIVSAVSASLAMAMSASAFAADNYSPAMKTAIQRDLGLSGTRLAQYVKAERLAAHQQRTAARQLGRDFAGVWLERKADGSFGVVTATTSKGKAGNASGIETRQARYSLAALNAAKDQLDAQLARSGVPRGVYSWAVDLPRNSVVVGIAPDAQDAAIDFIARSGVDADSVRFETMKNPPQRHATIQGGRGYRAGPYACTVGFPVTRGGTPGFATAGHCGNVGVVVYDEASGVRLGSFAGSAMPGPYQTGPDRGWVRVDAGHALSPSVYGYSNQDLPVRGSNEAAIGAVICRSGRTSGGLHCGYIISKNITVSYTDPNTGTHDGNVTGLTRTSACSDRGDSGGPFMAAAGQAQGVLSGGSGSCQNGGNTSFFTPINAVLGAYGLSLRTSP